MRSRLWTLVPAQVDSGGPVPISVEVENAGTRAGDEVVMGRFEVTGETFRVR